MLGGGGISMTGLAAWALTIVAEKSASPWPAAYFGYGCLILIGIVLTGFSAILGRRTFRFRVGDNELEASGEDAERVLDKGE
jgi:hypothetical protein